MIEIRDLVHIYNREESDGIGDSSSPNEVQALDGLSLSVADGEFVAIIGHNGCGKSTLAKHLNGLLLPTSGDVWIKGMNTKDKEHLWEIRQKVGMIFQNPDNQLVAAVVEEDIAFGCENLGIPPEEIRERVDQCGYASFQMECGSPPFWGTEAEGCDRRSYRDETRMYRLG